jgi:protein gp37
MVSIDYEDTLRAAKRLLAAGPFWLLDLWERLGPQLQRGESGPHFRPPRIEWVRDLRDQVKAAGLPFFFKQWGGHTPKAGGKVLDGCEWSEVPLA